MNKMPLIPEQIPSMISNVPGRARVFVSTRISSNTITKIDIFADYAMLQTADFKIFFCTPKQASRMNVGDVVEIVVKS